MARSTFSGPVASTNGFIGAVPATSTAATYAITEALDANRVTKLDLATGQAVTLPEATGSGTTYTLFIGTTITSNTTTVTAEGDGTMAGVAIVANDGGATASIFETVAGDNTITFDGSTTGGILGTKVVLMDVAADLWSVVITTAATSTEATPFSTV